MALKQLIKYDGNQTLNNKGFTIIEVLIAMAIFAIGILGVATMQISSINGNASVRKYSEAAAFAQDQIELLMSAPFSTMPMPAAASPSISISGADIMKDGYTVRTAYWIDIDADGEDDANIDMDGDGDNDILRIEVIVFDPSGTERSRLSFLKTADI